MRIWYLADARLPGQAANTVQIMKMCAAFAACGAEVTLLARVHPAAAGDDLFDFYAVPRNFRVVRAPRLVPGRSRRDAWNIPFSLSAYPTLRLRRNRFDIAYTRLPFLAMLAARGGVPVALEAHRLLPDQGWLGSCLAARLPRCALRPAFRGLVGISDALCRWYLDRGVPAEKTLAAHDGVDLERFTPALDRKAARQMRGLPADRPVVAYCGHLYPGRGIDELLSVAGALPRAVFLFVGGSEGDIARYRTLAADHELANVQFTGFVRQSEIPGWLFAADVLVMPYNRQTGSSWFMSPMKLFEYMAAERPIVATNFPSVAEILRDGHNAILVEPENPAALRAGVERALQGPDSGRLARQARIEVEHHTWTRRARRILDFLGSTK